MLNFKTNCRVINKNIDRILKISWHVHGELLELSSPPHRNKITGDAVLTDSVQFQAIKGLLPRWLLQLINLLKTFQSPLNKISDGSALDEIAQLRTKPQLSKKLRLKLRDSTYYSSSLESFSGQSQTLSARLAPIANKNAIFQNKVALRNASDTKNAITNAWNRFMHAFEISRLRLFVQIILPRLAQFISFVKDGMFILRMDYGYAKF